MRNKNKNNVMRNKDWNTKKSLDKVETKEKESVMNYIFTEMWLDSIHIESHVEIVA